MADHEKSPNGIQWEAEIVKNILENEGIEAFVNDEIIGTLAPYYENFLMYNI